jgi:hypothetical protein
MLDFRTRPWRLWKFLIIVGLLLVLAIISNPWFGVVLLVVVLVGVLCTALIRSSSGKAKSDSIIPR